MKFVYLIQGAADRLSALPLPGDATVYALVYDRDVAIGRARVTIFDPASSWAEGRNRLVEMAARLEPDADYFIFSDDDVEFLAGSFSEFEHMVQTTRPKIAVPVVPRTREGKVVLDCTVQQAIMLDEQLVAMHRSVVGTAPVCPLVTAYDSQSWFVACQLFEYYAQKLFGRECLQFNAIEISNHQHAADTGKTLYIRGTPEIRRRCLAHYFNLRGEKYDPTILFLWKQNPASHTEGFWRKYARVVRRWRAPLKLHYR